MPAPTLRPDQVAIVQIELSFIAAARQQCIDDAPDHPFARHHAEVRAAVLAALVALGAMAQAAAEPAP